MCQINATCVKSRSAKCIKLINAKCVKLTSYAKCVNNINAKCVKLTRTAKCENSGHRIDIIKTFNCLCNSVDACAFLRVRVMCSCPATISYAWHLSKSWQTWHKRRPIMVAFSDTAWRWRYQLPSRSASINLRIICTMLMYCVHKLVKPFHKLTTWSTQLSQLSQL